ncbi:MAG: hypothetical protein ACRDJ4_10875 [Actinomycetota bacterium]
MSISPLRPDFDMGVAFFLTVSLVGISFGDGAHQYLRYILEAFGT